ncbi:MAG: Wzz/FepE/Etk N-terminal domain-containing protein [Candidatus Rokubacteria bacterium]|nr:Wzz/FepE/Etk N-terminal domain-containing protein [Candidatus Rokubacteria bacterium]
MDEQASPHGSVTDRILGALRRRKWIALVAFLVPFSALMSTIAFLPKIYRSTATVLVERQQVPESFVKATVTSELQTRLDTISQEILSRSRLQGVIERFGLYPEARSRVAPDDLVIRMRRDIQVRLEEGGPKGATVAFAVSYTGRDPETAAQVANTLASAYVEENLKVRERQAAGTAEFLRAQLAEMKNKLDVQERQVSEFKRRNVGGLPQQIDANLSTLERLNSQLRLNSDSQTRVLERQQALRRQLAEGGPIVLGPGGGPDNLATRLAQLKQQLTELQTQYSEKYPDVIRTKNEIAVLERQMAAADKKPPPAPRETPSTDPYVGRARQALAEVEAELRVLHGEEQRLRQAIGTYQGRVESTPVREQEYQELSRDYETTREMYRSLLTKYGEAQIAESMEQRQKGEQFRILDPALPMRAPAAPKRLPLSVLALALSLGLAALAVVVMETLDTSFHSVDELRRFTSVAVLASIPVVLTDGDARRRRRAMTLALATGALGLVLIVGLSYLLAHGNESLVVLLSRGRP